MTMRFPQARMAAAACAALLGLAARADAQSADSLYPLRLLDRPTTLPRGASRLDLVVLANRQPHAATSWTGIVGGGIGVTSRLEVGGQILPATFAPGDGRFTNPSIYATFAFPVRKVSVAPTVQTVFPLASGDPFFVDAGVPAYYAIGSVGYVSVAPTLSVNTRSNGAGTSFSLPVAFVRQMTTQLTWELASGIGRTRFDPRFGLGRRSDSIEFDETTIPLSAQLMYSLGRRRERRPLADVSLQMQFPQLYSRVPGRRGAHTDDWALQLQTSWYAIP